MLAERLAGLPVDAPGPAAFVVDRNPGVATQCVVAKGRDQGEPGEQPLGHPPVVTVRLAVAPPEQRQAEGILLDFEDDIAVGLDVVQRFHALVHRIGVDLVTVHVGHVGGVDAALHGLQVAAGLHALGHEDTVRGQKAPFELRGRRLPVGRPHVRPDDAAALYAGIALDMHVRAGLGRRGNLHATAVSVELDTVVGAADPVFLVAAEIQRDAPVGAELVDQAGAAVGIAKRQELFAKQPDPNLRAVGLRDLARLQGGDPVAAHQGAHGRAGTDAGEGFRHLLVQAKTPWGSPLHRVARFF
jgi:hypothetical protein